MSKVLVVGCGGREHALTKRIMEDEGVTEVIAAPGSDAISQVEGARSVAGVSASNHSSLAELAARESVDLVVVGPEAPLADGLADYLNGREIRVLGPGRFAARSLANEAAGKINFEGKQMRTDIGSNL